MMINKWTALSALGALVSPCVVVASDAAGGTFQRFQPTRISYQALLDTETNQEDMDATFEAFSLQGMLAVTDIPGMADKKKLLQRLARCINKESSSSKNAATVQSFTFPDGTNRRTLATHTTPQEGAKPLTTPHENEDCLTLQDESKSFRQAVATTTQLVSLRLSNHLGLSSMNEPPLLLRANNKKKEQQQEGYATLADVVNRGEHLEHFHLYQKKADKKKLAATTAKANVNDSEQQKEHQGTTIEMHTDQGLMIAFTPGQWVSVQQDTTTTATKGNDDNLSSGFYMEVLNNLDEKVIAEVNFEPTDDLVFMLGDGVNQYINNRDQQGAQKKQKSDIALHAVPHTLRMPTHTQDTARAWYGRMVLPPQDAIANPETGETFGEVRAALIRASLDGSEEELQGLGCSGGGGHGKNVQVARDLSASEGCDEDSIRCWHRCMPLADEGLTRTSCSDQGLDLVCTNPRSLLSDGNSHGDYFPGCLNAAEAQPDESYPKLPDFPRNEQVCAPEEYQTLLNGIAPEFDHQASLNGNATLFWTVTPENTVKAKLAFNGLFGWLSIGIAGPDGSGKSGMHNAKVVMALPGGDYSAVTGLNLDQEPQVGEYMIHPQMTAFRHWMTPFAPTPPATDQVAAQATEGAPPMYSVEETECHVVLTFQVDSIHGQKLNLAGTDEMVWAANNQDYFVGYHGRDNRARFTMDWQNGKITMAGHDHGDHDHGSHDKDGGGVNVQQEGSSAAAQGVAGWTASLSMIASVALLFASWE